MSQPNEFMQLLEELEAYQASKAPPAAPTPRLAKAIPTIGGEPVRFVDTRAADRLMRQVQADIAQLQRGAARQRAAMRPLHREHRIATANRVMAKALAAVRAGAMTAHQAAVLEARANQLKATA